MFNIFKLYPTHFSRGEKFFLGGLCLPFSLPGYGPEHRPDPTWHALDEASAQLCGHVETPGWLDGLNRRWKTGWMLLSNSSLQFCPEIFNWIKVRAISRPSQQFDIFRLEKVRDDFCPMAWRPSCINLSQLCTAMCNSNFSFINSRYFLPFMLIPGSRKNRPAVPWVEIAPQIITLGVCFMVCCVNLSLYRISGGLNGWVFMTWNSLLRHTLAHQKGRCNREWFLMQHCGTSSFAHKNRLWS